MHDRTLNLGVWRVKSGEWGNEMIAESGEEVRRRGGVECGVQTQVTDAQTSAKMVITAATSSRDTFETTPRRGLVDGWEHKRNIQRHSLTPKPPQSATGTLRFEEKKPPLLREAAESCPARCLRYLPCLKSVQSPRVGWPSAEQWRRGSAVDLTGHFQSGIHDAGIRSQVLGYQIGEHLPGAGLYQMEPSDLMKPASFPELQMISCSPKPGFSGLSLIYKGVFLHSQKMLKWC